MIVSSPGSPSSSSDSQSGAESVKHCLPSRVSSPAIRASPSSQAALRSSSSVTMSSPGIRQSPSVTINSPGIRHSPSITGGTSVGSPGPRNSPSISSLSRASPSLMGQVARSCSPAMQASSAGLNVTMGSTTPSFSSMTGMPINISTSSTSGFSWTFSQPSSYTQPTTYPSTNPFLTGAYMSYTPGESSSNYLDKFNTIGTSKEVKSFFESYTSDNPKYQTLNSKSTGYDSSTMYGGTENRSELMSAKYSEKSGYLSSAYPSESKYSPSRSNGYDMSPNPTQSSSSTSGLLNVEDTPTPTSSIETEDSHPREVGEKDVEGDVEQSD